MPDFMSNTLKDKTITELEEIISTAVSEAIGEKLEATISVIDYGNGALPEAKINLHLKTPIAL